MARFSLDPVDGQTVKNIRLGSVQHTLHIDPQGATGTLTVEADPGRNDNWRSIPYTFDLSAPGVYSFTGPVARYRFTLSGVTGSNPIIIEDAGGKVQHQGAGYDYGQGFPEGAFTGLRALTTQPYTEANVKNGLQYYIRASWTIDGEDEISSGATVKIHFQIGSKPLLVKRRELSFIGEEVRLTLYEGPTGVTGGTGVDVNNWNAVNGIASTVTVTRDVSTTTDGTAIESEPEYFFGGNSQGQRVASSIPQGRERVLPANTEYLVAITNTGGGSARIGYFLDWYEGGTDLPINE